MSAAELIRRATEAGVVMAVGQDGRLQLRAESPPPADLVNELAAHKMEILTTLCAANETTAPEAVWLHLLALADGRVIQRTGNLTTPVVKQDAIRRYGDDLLVVVAVAGFKRPLTEAEIAPALVGTFAVPAALPPSSSVWLARVARLLGTRPTDLLKSEHLEAHDLVELAGSDAALAAQTILNSPAWINRSAPPVPPVAVMLGEEGGQPQRTVNTAATASVAWSAERDQFNQHLMTCEVCHAPLERYCPSGSGCGSFTTPLHGKRTND